MLGSRLVASFNFYRSLTVNPGTVNLSSYTYSLFSIFSETPCRSVVNFYNFWNFISKNTGWQVIHWSAGLEVYSVLHHVIIRGIGKILKAPKSYCKYIREVIALFRLTTCKLRNKTLLVFSHKERYGRWGLWFAILYLERTMSTWNLRYHEDIFNKIVQPWRSAEFFSK